MFIKKSKFDKLIKNLEELNFVLNKNKLIELAELIGNPKKMLWRNFSSGIIKGIGIGIGFSILTAILVIILQKIVTLNIPVIGDYIRDIIDIVEGSR